MPKNLKLKKISTPSTLLPWERKLVYEPSESQECISSPDLAPRFSQLKQEYQLISQKESYKQVFKKNNPLVTTITTTYNNSKDLINISLKSILNQTYKNLQIIVIADHSTDDTDLQMSKIKDSRIIYKNLETRTIYPGKTKRDVWLIAGTVPVNVGLTIATGDFITFCDQDDSFTPERIEKLLKFSQENSFDMLHHPFYIGTPDNIKNKYDSIEFSLGKVTTSAVFHHGWFKQLPWDLNCWQIDEPGDWNRFKKFKEINAKIGRYPEYLTYKG